MWYRLTNDKKDHDYIIRQFKPFVNSELGKALGLDYKKIQRAQWQRIYLKSWDRWRNRSARVWNGWTFYEIDPGDFAFCGLKVGNVIDLNEIRKKSTLKQISAIKSKDVKIKRKEKKVKKILGNSWSDCFKL